MHAQASAVAAEFYCNHFTDECSLAFDLHLDFLDMPRYIASGIHEKTLVSKAAGKGKSKAGGAAGVSGHGSHSSGHKYRFLVMQRFGDDLQKKLEQVSHTFDLKTTFTTAAAWTQSGSHSSLPLTCLPLSFAHTLSSLSSRCRLLQPQASSQRDCCRKTGLVLQSASASVQPGLRRRKMQDPLLQLLLPSQLQTSGVQLQQMQ